MSTYIPKPKSDDEDEKKDVAEKMDIYPG